METKIEPITAGSLAAAKKILEGGGVVAFPTETVYGLGADARSDGAVEAVFRIKGRPQDNPLIVHVHKDYDLSLLVEDGPPYAAKLRETFLPGPLTLIYKSLGKVSAKVSCGLDTLAVRVPSHPGAQAFLRAADMPVAAPSANRSKHVSPVTAEHVYADLAGKIPLILDGGPCEGGIESTVADVRGPYPVILREGLVSREMIAAVCGRCEVYRAKGDERNVPSPGMKYRHYAPSCETRLFAADELDAARSFAEESVKGGRRTAVLCESGAETAFALPGITILSLGAGAEEAARNLYARLREAEAGADLLIAVEPAEQDGIMAGVLNRLRKSCAR